MLCAALLATGALVFAALSGPAEAAFPGKNGKIVFASNRTTGAGVHSPSGDYEIFAMTSAGTGLVQLTDNSAADYGPAYSPDGSRVAFVRGDDVYVMNADGTGQRRLTNAFEGSYDPAYSPDGTSIAFTRGLSNAEVWVMDADGANERALVETWGQASARKPAYSPDGSMLAFECRDVAVAFHSDVCTVRPDGVTGWKQLTTDFAADTDPAWSNLGGTILFTSERDGHEEVYIMNADGTNQGRETNSSKNSRHPIFSPDGGKISFASDRDGDSDIYVMSASPESATNTPVKLTQNGADDRDPDWQPLPRCTKTGTAGDDTLVGTADEDVLCGLGGNDTVDGMGGDDIALGGAGDDRLVGSADNDIMNGQSGTDLAVYSGSVAAVQASLATGFAKGQGSDALGGVESLIGSNLDDALTGSGAANSLFGFGGADTLRAGPGGDRVVGGSGDDRLLGEDGDDWLDATDGVNGNDRLNGGTGKDTCAKDATEASVVGCP